MINGLSDAAKAKLETMGGARIGQVVENLDLAPALLAELKDCGVIDKRNGLTRSGSITAARLQRAYENRVFGL